MKKSKNAAFTLIELVAVLVIMVIIALIVTPLVMNIIRNARIAADKRSVDAYGRSIEYAIASYLLDNGRFPTDISDLTIEYSGNEVLCSQARLNSDSSVYLSGCTVGGREVDYSYGTDKAPSLRAYSVGDEITYNGVDYYVIADSGVDQSTVKLLKAEPLTVDEVNLYGGVGTENNHVNMYISTGDGSYQQAYDINGYGGMQYLSSETCGANSSDLGCTYLYTTSDVKYVVDAWATAKAPAATEARLITEDEYSVLTVEETYGEPPSEVITNVVPQYNWLYNNDYNYWTMSQQYDNDRGGWVVGQDGTLQHAYINYGSWLPSNTVVRPVIVLDKSVLN